MTEQSFAYETDINNIVKRGVQSSLPPNNQKPIFGQTFSPNQYSEALNTIASAKSQFEELPSHIRHKFENNPAKLLAFCSDEKNYEEAVKLGLANKKVENSQPGIKNPTEVTTEPAKPVVNPIVTD